MAMKKFPALVFLLLLLPASAMAAGEKLLEITTRETTIYASPGVGWTDNRLMRGMRVRLTGEMKDGWYPVMMRNGEEGWVASWLAKPVTGSGPLLAAFTEEDIPTLEQPLYARVIANHAYFRNVPYGGLSGKWDTTRSGLIPRGAVLAITDRVGHWMQARLSPTETGWVFDEWLEPVEKPERNLSHGVPVAELISLHASRRKGRVELRAKLSRAMPYSVRSNVDPALVKFTIYGVDCDYLGWRWNWHCKKAGGTCHCPLETEVLEGYIPAPAGMAGHEAGYTGGIFNLDVFNPRKSPIRRVVIDPGHGAPEPYHPGYAEGAYGPDECVEHEVVMDISKLLAGLLEKAGLEALLTRDGISTDMMDIYNRVLFTRKNDADLFVSVHANGDLDPEEQGVEVYWNEPQSRVPAEILARTITAATGRDRGKAAYGSFAVIRETAIPSVLVEAGYLTNDEEGKLLCSGEYRKKVARGIADGILEYIASFE